MKKTANVLKAVTVLLALAVIGCLIAICVLTGAFNAILKPETKPETPPASTDPDQTSKIESMLLPRQAANGRSVFGGEKDDRIKAGYDLENRILIVGDTSSHSADMSSALSGDNLFVAVLTPDLTVTAVFPFGTDFNDQCVASALGSDGVCVLSTAEQEYRFDVFTYKDRRLDSYPLPFPLGTVPKDCLRLHGDVWVAAESNGAVLLARFSGGAFDPPLRFVVPGGTLAYGAALPTADGVRVFALLNKKNLLVADDTHGAQDVRDFDHDFVIRQIKAVTPTGSGYAVLVSDGNADRLITLDYGLDAHACTVLPCSDAVGVTGIRGTVLVESPTALYTVLWQEVIRTSFTGNKILRVRYDGIPVAETSDHAVSVGDHSVGNYAGITDCRFIGGGFCCISAAGPLGQSDLFVLAVPDELCRAA